MNAFAEPLLVTAHGSLHTVASNVMQHAFMYLAPTFQYP